MKTFLFRVGVCLAVAAAACSTATKSRQSPGPAPTPTPGPLSRVNPNIIEETETYIVERFPKKDYIRVDDRHIRNPIVGPAVEFFKEDADYYYVQTSKVPSAEELALRRQADLKAAAAEGRTTLEAPKGPVVSPAEFADIVPPRVDRRIRLDEAAGSGLPMGGMWRSSFVIADVNGDGIPDVVAPPARLGGQSTLHIFIGDGKGKFSRWPVTFTEGGKPKEAFSLAYGGVAVGDLDGDGNPDVVAASHLAGLVALYGNGKGSFEIVRTGLPGRTFSTQAVALADADGDGKLDIIASTDGFGTGNEANVAVDKQQVRVYLNRGAKGWEFKGDGIVGGFYSNALEAWDYDGDGAMDLLAGSHYIGALTIVWKNDRNGTFSPISFPELENFSYHFATSAGTFGVARTPAFAETISMHAVEPEPMRASGVTIYSYDKGAWTRHRVWRKKGGDMLLYALAMEDLDGDGLDDVVFPDSEDRRLRVFFQERDGTFREMDGKEEPRLDSPGQCVRLADLDGDKRLDVVLSKTITSTKPDDPGGWTVWLNRIPAGSRPR